MQTPEYIPQNYIPPDTIKKYHLHSKFHNGFIYCEINKGIHGLKQAALFAYDNFLVKNLQPYGYYPIPNTIDIWKHKSRPITFCLCADDFGIKYFYKHDVDHLRNALQQYYKISIDWEGKYDCGINLQWNYKENCVDITMPDHTPSLLKIFQLTKTKPTYTPYKPLLSYHKIR